jgi:hypothetical protein
MTSIPDWRVEVGIAFGLRRAVSERWPDVYPLRYPGVAASRQLLASIGGPTADRQLADLLATVDGWPSFFANVDLLSTGQLQGSADLDVGNEIIEVLYDEDAPEGWPDGGGLAVIGAKQGFADVIAIDMAGPETDGGHPVYWFGGGDLIESFADVGEFFVSTHDYLRRRLEVGLPG